METKRNVKYFTAPPISIVTIIALVFTVVMFVLIFNSKTLPIGVIGVIVGIAVVAFSSGGKASDVDIEYQATEYTKDLEEESMKKYEVYEKNFLKTMKPLNFRGYDYDESREGFYYRKGRDGTPRTSYFSAANMIFTSEKVYIYSKRISLVDETKHDIITGSYKYSDLDRAMIEEKSYTVKGSKGNATIPLYLFTLLKKNGEKAFEMYVDYGADTDLAVDNINRTIKVRTEELHKLAAEKAEKLAAFRAKVAKEAAEEKAQAEAETKKNKKSASRAKEAVSEVAAEAEEVAESAEEKVEETAGAVEKTVDGIKENVAEEIKNEATEAAEEVKEEVADAAGEIADNI